MLILKIFSAIFLLAGFGTVFAAKSLVTRYGLDTRVGCDFENEMNDEEVKQYKFNRASVNLKMIGMIVSVPGIIMILLAYK